MSNKAIIAVVIVLIGIVAAGVFLYTSGNVTHQGQTALNKTTSVKTTTIKASNSSKQQYTKIYVGSSATFMNQYTVQLVGISKSGGQPLAILNITNDYGAFNRTIGASQYVGLGPNATAPYVLLSQIFDNSSVSSQDWATVNMSTSSTGSFSEAQNNGFHYNTYNTSTPFVKLYNGKSSSLLGYSLKVMNISSKYNVQLNVSSSSGSFSNFWISPHMYYSVQGNDQPPYVVLDNITYNSSNPAQSWINVSMRMDSFDFNYTNGTYINLAPPTRAYGWAVDLNLPSCGATNSLLETTPIAPSEFVSINPLGWLNEEDGHVVPSDHIGFYMVPSGMEIPPLVNVVSPGNVTVFSVDSRSYNNGYSDYTLYFSSCTNVTFWLGHVRYITNQKLLNSLTPENATACSNASESSSISTHDCSYNVSVQLSANEVLGQFGGSSYVLGLDMGAYDSRLAPATYADSYYLYNYYNGNYLGNISKMQFVACPLNYLPQDLQQNLTDRMGMFNVKWTSQPSCGYPVDQDTVDAAQGIWSAKRVSNYTTESGLIALVHDNLIPGMEVFSIGDASGLQGVVPGGVGYYFNYETTGYVNRDFANVTADGHVYCYDSMGTAYGDSSNHPQSIVSGRMLLQFVNTTTLRMEYQSGYGSCGSGPWNFTSAHSDFYR